MRGGAFGGRRGTAGARASRTRGEVRERREHPTADASPGPVGRRVRGRVLLLVAEIGPRVRAARAGGVAARGAVGAARRGEMERETGARFWVTERARKKKRERGTAGRLVSGRTSRRSWRSCPPSSRRSGRARRFPRCRRRRRCRGTSPRVPPWTPPPSSWRRRTVPPSPWTAYLPIGRGRRPRLGRGERARRRGTWT